MIIFWRLLFNLAFFLFRNIFLVKDFWLIINEAFLSFYWITYTTVVLILLFMPYAIQFLNLSGMIEMIGFFTDIICFWISTDQSHSIDWMVLKSTWLICHFVLKIIQYFFIITCFYDIRHRKVKYVSFESIRASVSLFMKGNILQSLFFLNCIL